MVNLSSFSIPFSLNRLSIYLLSSSETNISSSLFLVSIPKFLTTFRSCSMVCSLIPEGFTRWVKRSLLPRAPFPLKCQWKRRYPNLGKRFLKVIFSLGTPKLALIFAPLKKESTAPRSPPPKSMAKSNPLSLMPFAHLRLLTIFFILGNFFRERSKVKTSLIKGFPVSISSVPLFTRQAMYALGNLSLKARSVGTINNTSPICLNFITSILCTLLRSTFLSITLPLSRLSILPLLYPASPQF